MKTFFVERDSSEWRAMWHAVAQHPLNADLADPSAAMEEVSGEIWQYMGSSEGNHCFRHRYHPKTQKREYINVPISVSSGVTVH